MVSEVSRLKVMQALNPSKTFSLIIISMGAEAFSFFKAGVDDLHRFSGFT